MRRSLFVSVSEVQRLFEVHARERPGWPAVVTAHTTITYGDLDGRANWLAHRLLDGGAGVGETVAVVSARPAEVMVGVLAAVKAGRAYVVLDPGNRWVSLVGC